MWHLHTSKLLLASESPRRLSLLKQLGLNVQVLRLPPQEDDEPVFDNECPENYVSRTCLDKNFRARAYVQQHQHGLENLPILTGDTTVALQGEILGKPESPQQALQFLRLLNGQTHDVFSAVAVCWEDDIDYIRTHTKVTFSKQPDDVLKQYVKSGEPMGKAGAYAIQGLAAAFIAHIEGSYTGVVGLPVYETVTLLQTMDLISCTDSNGVLT
ncbi:Maf family protein [Orrella sp. 11846]|uniref:Maf family protein n=1 Tax=Orrella sp. 11846 TaxID=3409913 RepID=UPI003B591860